MFALGMATQGMVTQGMVTQGMVTRAPSQLRLGTGLITPAAPAITLVVPITCGGLDIGSGGMANGSGSTVATW